MNNQNAELEFLEIYDEYTPFNFDELENQLENDLISQFADLELLAEESKKIKKTEGLEIVIYDTVMDHIKNQIAGLGAEEFIENNRGLEFDPRDSAHIQTTENFSVGKIATHNDEIDFQKRYDDWQGNFQKEKNGTDDYQKKLAKNARDPFDKGRDKGSATVHKDHTVSVGEIIRDPQTNAHLEKQEQIKFANSDKNLNDLDASANQSKGDKKMTDWLDSERDGKKPAERFAIDEEELREQDKIAREEYKEIKLEGERKSIETGKKSQKKEMVKMGTEVGKAIGVQLIMILLKNFLIETIRKLIIWLKSGNKKIETFLAALKDAIHTFVKNLKNEIGKHVKNSLSTSSKLIVSAIFKPIGRLLKKFGAMISQGFKVVRDSIDYLINPENKNVPFSIKFAQVGKIIVTGLTATGAILGGQLIESGLIAIPVIGQILAFEIPLVGSLASLIGLFVGAMAAGILGAIILNWIDRFISRRLENEAVKQKIDKNNEVLEAQARLFFIREEKLINEKNEVINLIKNRNIMASGIMKESLSKIYANDEKTKKNIIDNQNDFEDIFKNLNEL